MNPVGYEIKGSLLRAYLAQVEALGLLEQVTERVSESSRELFKNRPVASSWIDASVIEDLINATEAVGGVEAVRTVTLKGQMTGLEPLLRPVIGGLLRLFGSSPAALLNRFAQLTSTNVRGKIEFAWTNEGDRSGYLRVTLPGRKNVPRNVFIGFESGLHNIINVCGGTGKVGKAEMSPDGSSATIRASW